jgi:hypothetical protein
MGSVLTGHFTENPIAFTLIMLGSFTVMPWSAAAQNTESGSNIGRPENPIMGVS